MVEQHQRFRTVRLIFNPVRHRDGRLTIPGLDAPAQNHIFPEQLRLPHLAAYPKHIFVSFPKAVCHKMLRRRGADPPVHGVILFIQTAGRADIFQPGRKEQPAHNAALGLLPVCVIMVPALQSGLGKKVEAYAFIGKFLHIQAFIRKDLKL